MAFKPIILGRTGLKATRLGIGSSYGTDRAMVEAAVERGVNYLYWGAMKTSRMAAGIRSVAAANRDKLIIVLQTSTRLPASLTKIVEDGLKTLGIDYIDVLLLGWINQKLGNKMLDKIQELKNRELIRFLAISSHKRKLFPELEKNKLIDIYHIRYNAAHRGAEEEVFPFFSETDGPGAVTFTTTRWGGLLNPNKMPDGVSTPRPRDCYRFVLSHPKVNVAIAGPNSMDQLMEDLKALEEGPMNDDELEGMRSIGDHVHGTSGIFDQIRGLRSIRLWGKSG